MVTTIKITKMDWGRSTDIYNISVWCNTVLKLRYARKVGDTKRVNNYVLGTLRRCRGENFDFEELTNK